MRRSQQTEFVSWKNRCDGKSRGERTGAGQGFDTGRSSWVWWGSRVLGFGKTVTVKPFYTIPNGLT